MAPPKIPPPAVSQYGVDEGQSESIRQPTHRLFVMSQTIAPASVHCAFETQPAPQVPFARQTGPAAELEQSALVAHSTHVLLALQCVAPPSLLAQSELVWHWTHCCETVSQIGVIRPKPPIPPSRMQSEEVWQPTHAPVVVSQIAVAPAHRVPPSPSQLV